MKRQGSVECCPVCGAGLPAPSGQYGETSCPRCSGELWHLALTSGPTFFVRRPGENIYKLMADILGLATEELEGTLKEADSFDVVELLKEVGGALRS
jgi:hypothetical protein